MFRRYIALSLALSLSVPAFASVGECPSEQDFGHLSDFRDRIATAESPEAAREMALAQTRLGHKAISRVAKMMPGDENVQAAEARLVAFEQGVESSATQAEVASQFDTLMASQRTGMNCDYDTTEVVIIVIGFLLGILPGILFLFLFC